MDDLVAKAQNLAKTTTLPVRDICTRAQVSRRWFYRFRNGEFKDPGTKRVQRLIKTLQVKQRKRRLRKIAAPP